MKRSHNIIFLCCIAAGLCLMFAGSVMGAKKSLYIDSYGFHTNDESASSSNGTAITSEELAAFTEIQINVVSLDVTLEPADFYGLDANYNSGQDITWEVKNGALIVKEHSKKGRLYLFNFNMDFASSSNYNSYVRIYCPEDVLRGLSVKTVSGDIQCSEITASKVNLSSTSGRITYSDSHPQDVVLETVSGEIDTESVATQALSAKSVSGRITLIDGNAHTLKVNSTSGDINLQDCNGDDIRLNGISSRIDFATDISQSSFNIRNNTVSGDVRINGDRIKSGQHQHSDNTKHSLFTETVSGNINLTFE